MVDVTVVIPVFQGRENIDPLLGELVPQMESLGCCWEILFVDDHSRDGSFSLIRERHRQDPRVRGIRLVRNRGQQNAVYCGICEARGERIITMDDDLQHPPGVIPALIDALSEDCDLVYGVNRRRKRSFFLAAGTHVTGLFFFLFLKKPWSVAISSYRVLTRRLARQIAGEERSFIYVSALLFRLNPAPRAATVFYDGSPGKTSGKSRFSFCRRLALFAKLFIHFGPLSFLFPFGGTPYEIGESL